MPSRNSDRRKLSGHRIGLGGGRSFFFDHGIYLLALEMLCEDTLHRPVEREAVLLVMESVPLVVLDHVVHVHSPCAQRGDHLIRFGLIDARVVGSLHDQ